MLVCQEIISFILGQSVSKTLNVLTVCLIHSFSYLLKPSVCIKWSKPLLFNKGKLDIESALVAVIKLDLLITIATISSFRPFFNPFFLEYLILSEP